MKKTVFFTTTVPYTGMGNIFEILCTNFKKNKDNVVPIQFIYRKDKKNFSGARHETGLLLFKNNWFLNDLLNIHSRVVRKVATNDVNIIHFSDPFSLPDISTLKWLKAKGKVLICTVNDMIDQIIGPYNYHVEEKWMFSTTRKLVGKDPATRSKSYVERIAMMDEIITISEYTKRDLEMIFSLIGIDFDSKKITPIHIGVEHDIFKPLIDVTKEDLRKKHSLPLNTKIIISISSEEPRKNLHTVYKTLEKLPRNYILLRVGEISGRNKKLIKELKIENRVIQKKGLHPLQMCELLNAGDVFVFPTMYEGFGLPPLEAMSCGLPTICSEWTSMKEIIGEAALIPANIFDAVELKRLIMNVCEKDDVKKSLSRMGQIQAGKFSWKDTYNKTKTIYCKY